MKNSNLKFSLEQIEVGSLFVSVSLIEKNIDIVLIAENS